MDSYKNLWDACIGKLVTKVPTFGLRSKILKHNNFKLERKHMEEYEDNNYDEDDEDQYNRVKF